jgi:hypothetical protein
VRRDVVYGRLRKQRCGLHASAAATRVLSGHFVAAERAAGRWQPRGTGWACQ